MKNKKQIPSFILRHQIFVLCVSIAIFIIFFLSLTLYSKQHTMKNLMLRNLSEIQQTYHHFQDEDYEISLISGYREKTYILDGNKTDLKPYCVIMLKSKQNELIKNVSLQVNNKKYTFSPSKNPFNEEYVYDLEILLNNQQLPIIQIDNNQEIILEDVTLNFKMDYLDCVDLLVQSKKEEIKPLIKNFKFNAEIYVRIIQNSIYDNFYFHILIVDQNKQSIQFFIDPFTRQFV